MNMLIKGVRIKAFIFTVLVFFTNGLLGVDPFQIVHDPQNLEQSVASYEQMMKEYEQFEDYAKQIGDGKLTPATVSKLSSLYEKCGGMSVMYLVFKIAKSYIKDEPFRTDVYEKIVLFIVLATFLQFKYFDKYVVEPLELLFNGLPAMFNGSSSYSSIDNVLSQSGFLVSNIWDKFEFGGVASIARSIAMLIPAILATLSVISLTIVVILNVLLATLKFYLVLSLSSILILLAFFKFTRQYMINATQVIAGCILNITLLSVFLNMYGDIFASLVDIDSAEAGVMGFLTITILSSVGVVITKTISEVAQAITGSGLSSVGSGIGNPSQLTSLARSSITGMLKGR